MNLGEIAPTEHEGDSAFSPTIVPASPFRIWDGTTPEGWEVTENDQWKFYFPTDAELPDEGWKIHISTVLDEADQALDIVSEICRQNSIGFKFTPTREMLAFKLSKNVSRSAAGKFCCLYPRDEEECGRIVNILLHAPTSGAGTPRSSSGGALSPPCTAPTPTAFAVWPFTVPTASSSQTRGVPASTSRIG